MTCEEPKEIWTVERTKIIGKHSVPPFSNENFTTETLHQDLEDCILEGGLKRGHRTGVRAWAGIREEYVISA